MTQFKNFHWLSHDGISIISCSTNMVLMHNFGGCFYFF